MPNPSQPEPLAPDLRGQLLQSLNAQYFGLATQTGAFVIITNLLIAGTFYLRYGKPSILLWAAAAVLLPLVRIRMGARYRREVHAHADAQLWERRAFGITMLIALVYAAGLLVLFEDGSPIYNGLLTGCYVMMISSAAASASAMKRTMLGFCGVMGVSLVVRLAVSEHPVYWLAAIAAGVYTAAQMVFGLQNHRLLAASLEQSLINKALARQLEEQVRIALQADREKSRFLAAASHDMRQPLHAIALSTDALYRTLANTPQGRDVDVLRQSVAALGESLDAMLDLSKLDAGAVATRIEAVDVAAIFAHLHSTFLARANARGLGLRMRHGGARVLADRHQLTRLLTNLVDNAVKYTDTGGVLVAARRTRHEGGYGWVIEVRDSGIGIPAQYHEQVFEEFFQATNPGRLRNLGMGLGLSIVKRLALLMDMRLAVRSGEGCGTTVKLRCRAAGPSAPTQAAPPVGDGKAHPPADFEAFETLRGKNILVVDNEVAILDAVARLLSPYGARVDVAVSAQDAESQVRVRGDYDLAMLDQRLGAEMTGTQLAARISALQPKGLAIVLITGDTDSDEIRAMRATGTEVLFKPLGGDALLAAVCRMVARA